MPKKKSGDSEFQSRLQEIVIELDNQRAALLWDICENDKLYLPELILNKVHQIRNITKMLKKLGINDIPNRNENHN
jgi:hypothetical protein